MAIPGLHHEIVSGLSCLTITGGGVAIQWFIQQSKTAIISMTTCEEVILQW